MNNQKCKFVFYGHNCFLIESNDSFLIIDPWLSDAGAFLGSWFQWPKNHHFQSFLADLTAQKKGFVFLSHEHEDHFDSETLNKFNSQTTLIIPDFRDKFLKNKIIGMNFPVVELKDSELFKISDDFFIEPYISDVGINHDSALLVKTKSFSFLNQNDCKIFDRLHEIKGDVDYYSVQFSGATSHPISYVNYTVKEKLKITNNKVNAKIKNVIDAIKLLKPKFYIPAAGPAVFPFLDYKLSSGYDNIFIHQDELKKKLLVHDISNVFYARPGESIDDKPTSPIPAPSKQQLKEYAEGLVCKWDSIVGDFDKSKLIECINKRLDAIWDLDFDCEFILCLKWGHDSDELIYIDLSAKQIVNFECGHDAKIYTVEAEEKYFSLMCSDLRWQDISLSLRASLKRAPDIFNNYINLFLYSDIEGIRDSFLDTLNIPKDRINVVGVDGFSYEVDRYCPHQGADLINAKVNADNQLICPRHSWCFSLENSGKCTLNDLSIVSLKLNRIDKI